MNFVVDERIVSEINSQSLKNEVEAYLNNLIDLELEKDEINTDFIDECIDAIDSFNNDDYTKALRVMLSEKQVVKYCKKHTSQKAPHSTLSKMTIAACLIVALCSSSFLAGSNTAFAKQVRELFSQIIYELNIAADYDDNTGSELVVSSLYATFPDSYSFEIKSKDDIRLDKISIIAVYQDNTEKSVAIDNCTVKVIDEVEDNPDEIMVVIGYKGCAFSVVYTIVR